MAFFCRKIQLLLIMNLSPRAPPGGDVAVGLLKAKVVPLVDGLTKLNPGCPLWLPPTKHHQGT